MRRWPARGRGGVGRGAFRRSRSGGRRAKFRGMFWQIAYCVVRGVFDNRERGRVTGRVWLCGRAEPLELDLRGDALRDLAGRKLEFFHRNPRPIEDRLAFLTGVQRGPVGDCTASRREKVPDVPEEERIPLTMKETLERMQHPEDFAFTPTHLANELYLEWFVPDFGRVTIRSTDCRLVVSPDIRWEMTPWEESEQLINNHTEFLALIQQAREKLRREMGHPDPEQDDEPRGW